MAKIRSLIKDCYRFVRETGNLLTVADAKTLAGSLAFSTVLSIVPLLAVGLGVFHAYGGFEPLIAKAETLLLQNFAAGADAQVIEVIRSSIRRIHSKTLGFWGLVGLLVSSTKLFLDIETAVQKIWGLQRTRPLWLRLGVYWTIIFLGPLMAAVAVGLITSIDFGLLEVLPKSTIGFVLMFVTLSAIFKLMPARHVYKRAAIWSAFISSVTVLGLQSFFAVIAQKLLAYNKIYGSLASIPIFLMWLLFLWTAVLLGVATTRYFQEGMERKRSIVHGPL